MSRKPFHKAAHLLCAGVLFLSLASGNALVSVADLALTNSAVKRGAIEANPLLGRRPSAARIYSQGLGVLAIQSAIAYRLNRNHPRVARVFLAGSAVLQSYCVARAAKVVSRQ